MSSNQILNFPIINYLKNDKEILGFISKKIIYIENNNIEDIPIVFQYNFVELISNFITLNNNPDNKEFENNLLDYILNSCNRNKLEHIYNNTIQYINFQTERDYLNEIYLNDITTNTKSKKEIKQLILDIFEKLETTYNIFDFISNNYFWNKNKQSIKLNMKHYLNKKFEFELFSKLIYNYNYLIENIIGEINDMNEFNINNDNINKWWWNTNLFVEQQ